MKQADPLEQAKVKLKPQSKPESSLGAGETNPNPPTPPEPPPSLDEEKKNVVVPASKPAAPVQMLRVVCIPENKPYRVHVQGQAIVLRHGKILNPGSYTPQALQAFKDYGVQFEQVVESPPTVEDE